METIGPLNFSQYQDAKQHPTVSLTSPKIKNNAQFFSLSIFFSEFPVIRLYPFFLLGGL